MDKPEYLGLLKTTVVKGKRPSHLMTGILPSSVDATTGIPAKAGINNLDDLFAAGALQGEATTKEMEDFGTGVVEFAKEHPVSLATGLVGGALLPATIPGMLAMGAVGAGSELADAKIRGEDVSAKDLALAAGIQGLTHGILGRAPVEGINGEQALREAVTARGPIRQFAIPDNPRYIDASELGGISGYPMLNYDYIPGAAKTEAELASQGIHRLVPASTLSHKGAEQFGDRLVGNPVYMHNPLTPEGKIHAERMAARAQVLNELKTNLFSGIDANEPFDPEMVVGLATPESSKKFGTYTLDAYPDYPYNPKWGFIGEKEVKNTNKIPLNRGPYNNALTYAYPVKDDLKLRQMVMKAVNDGTITESNLPEGFSSIHDLVNRTLSTKGIAGGADIHLTRFVNSLPDNAPIVQELIPYTPKIRVIEKNGKAWATNEAGEPFDSYSEAWAMQRNQLSSANAEDVGGVLYMDVIDRGGAMRANRNQGSGNVLAVTDVGTLKYPFNYGLLNLNDMRPLAAVPLAAGLGAGIVNQSRQ